MASKHDTHSDGGHGGGGGGDHGGGHAAGGTKAKSGGGFLKSLANVLRKPVTWVVAGVGALAAALYSGVVPMPQVGTAPSSYSAPAPTDTAESGGDVRAPSEPGARRTARLNARTCHAIVQQARADHGRDWERELSSKVRRDCGRTIQEARWVDGRAPLEVEGTRGRMPGAGDDEIVRVSVPVGDLDLTTSAGAERVLDRVERAAVKACGGQPDMRDLEARRAFRDCVARSMDRAVAQLGAPRVTALHRRPG
jgi:UrcA family protein